MNNYSQIMQQNNNINRNSSCSSAEQSGESSFIIGTGDAQNDHGKDKGKFHCNDDMINTMQTSQHSIFDEAPTNAPDDSATFNRPQPEDYVTDQNRSVLKPPRKSNKKGSSRKNSRGSRNRATPNPKHNFVGH